MPKMIAMLSLDRYTHNTCHTTTFNRFQAKISILWDYFAQNIIQSAIFITFILNFCSFNAQQTKFTVSHWIEYSYLFLKSPQWSNLDNCNVFKRILCLCARALLQVTFSSATFFWKMPDGSLYHHSNPPMGAT